MLAFGCTGKSDSKFHGVSAVAFGHHILEILIGKQYLLQDAFGLKFAPHSAGLDVGQNLLQVSDSLRQSLHLSQLFVDALKLVADLLE